MDELVFDKKTYIASKRAARVSGYTKDYIGQLCRAGILPAKMVGRNWYIEEDALKEHRKTYQGESIVDSSAWDVDQVETDSRSLSEIAQQYIGDREIKKRNELIEELFDLKYETEGGDLLPRLEKHVDVNHRGKEATDGTVEGKSGGKIEESIHSESLPVKPQRTLSKPSAHVLALKPRRHEILATRPTHYIRELESAFEPIESSVFTTAQSTTTRFHAGLQKGAVIASLFIAAGALGSLFLERVSVYEYAEGNYIESKGSVTLNVVTGLTKRVQKLLKASPEEFDQTR